MAGEIPDLVVELRTGTGKGAARASRRHGMVPGVVYGGGVDPLLIQIRQNILMKTIKAGRFLSTLFNLKLDGHEDVRVICRSIQRDVVKDLPMHLDLMRLRRASRVNLFIPVVFVNEEKCVGIKRGGVLTVVRTEIELRVTAGEIPDSIIVDLDGLEMGQVITISSVKLPQGVRPIIERDFVIANISAPRGFSDSSDDVDSTDAPAEITSSEDNEE